MTAAEPHCRFGRQHFNVRLRICHGVAYSRYQQHFICRAVHIFAFGQAASIPTVTLCAIRCLSADDSASGNAVINTLQPLSGALGTSICASIVAAAQNASAGAAGTQTGTAHALVLLAVFTAVILFCNLYLLNGKSHTVNTPNLSVQK